jgi:hypothetical protein
LRKANSILLIGESDVGKTHYGAQLLKRLMKGDGALRMHGAASNLQPFEAALERLNEGIAAEHTTATTYVESIWPVVDSADRAGELIWPDYGGEQLKNISLSRKVPAAWRNRIVHASAWLFLLRLHKIRTSEDIFSKPFAQLVGARNEPREIHVSDQARLIDLFQMLIYAGGISLDRALKRPKLVVLLTCWDEMPAGVEVPADVLRSRLPMFSDFLLSSWGRPEVFGLSALGRTLSKTDPDGDYAAMGPEHFGYVVLPDGSRSQDLTLPIRVALSDSSELPQ